MLSSTGCAVPICRMYLRVKPRRAPAPEDRPLELCVFGFVWSSSLCVFRRRVPAKCRKLRPLRLLCPQRLLFVVCMPRVRQFDSPVGHFLTTRTSSENCAARRTTRRRPPMYWIPLMNGMFVEAHGQAGMADHSQPSARLDRALNLRRVLKLQDRSHFDARFSRP